MALHYLLDGYNIIHKVPSLWSDSIQKSREKLVKYMQIKRPQGSLKNRVTIVFDGRSEVVDYPMDTSPVLVKFTSQMSADEYIIQLVKKSTNPKITVVVSDDKEVQEKAHLLGARVVGVKDFFELEKKVKERKEIDKLSLTNKELKEIEEELMRKQRRSRSSD